MITTEITKDQEAISKMQSDIISRQIGFALEQYDLIMNKMEVRLKWKNEEAVYIKKQLASEPLTQDLLDEVIHFLHSGKPYFIDGVNDLEANAETAQRYLGEQKPCLPAE